MNYSNNDTIETMYLRLKKYLNELEILISKVLEELEDSRKERSEWFEWHEDWKNAWLNSDSNKKSLLEEEIENLKFMTSVRRRKTLFDLRNEVMELKKELEEVRENRELLMVFLNHSVFQN
ncbi:MAG: hypothetical protein L6Q54_07825 [Leptospiraceae bacterium]|nr:hypothetical protein [Leptospiraceae bacterium]MCK6381142.1 hypothetical protein [Leptospiraceae bacterium]NUM40568.1 hypothetical protein [Leptospiraceae bacterium]